MVLGEHSDYKPSRPKLAPMGGIELDGGVLHVERPPNELDRLAIEVSQILDNLQIDHVFVSGYVAILAGRARGTEDIDVLLERLDSATIDRLVEALDRHDMWGPAMPLDRMHEMLDDNIWIARADEMVPHLEMKYVSDRFDRASLTHRIPARIGDSEVPIGPIELQIAYKLWMGSRTDFEDAHHLYTLFEESLSMDELEAWVQDLGARKAYEQLKRA